MANVAGRSIPISPFRSLVADLMTMSRQVPAVTADRRMDLTPLADARGSLTPKPHWTVLFAKAFALLGRDYPELRQSWLKFPWPRIYEHPHSVVALNVERQWGRENIVLFCLIRGAENRSIADLEAVVREHQEAPVESLRTFQRTVAMSRIPWPFRQWFWWAALNVFGDQRCHHFGTFGITSVAGHGAGLLHLIPVLTSTLHFGLFDEQNRLDVRLSWDHRVMDGALVARVLRDMEAVLNHDIVRELRDARLNAA